MELIDPSFCYMQNSDYLYENNNYNWYDNNNSSKSSEWTREENKLFERALALYDENEPDRWRKVAAMIPGKTEFDVRKQYQELEDDVCDIEAGNIPIPGYDNNNNSPRFRLEHWGDQRNFDENRKKPRNGDHERKKGVPWTEEEHRRFLIGLIRHGKGDWRNISRNFVQSKTPTQVASHAQKYFIRQQLTGVKEKRRPSIHDITTSNLADMEQTNSLHNSQQKPKSMQRIFNDNWNQTRDGSAMFFNPNNQIQISPADLKFQGQALYANRPHFIQRHHFLR